MQTATYEQTWIDGLNRGDVSVAENVFAADCVIHINGSPDPNLDVAGFKQMIAGLLAAFPDLRLSIEDQIVAGDKVATRWVAEGTNSAPLGNVPATGRRVRVGGLVLDRVDHFVRELSPEREIVLYCTCPNEASAARIAKLLIERGFTRVRPLLGGLDAWIDAGFLAEDLPGIIAVREADSAQSGSKEQRKVESI